MMRLDNSEFKLDVGGGLIIRIKWEFNQRGRRGDREKFCYGEKGGKGREEGCVLGLIWRCLCG